MLLLYFLYKKNQKCLTKIYWKEEKKIIKSDCHCHGRFRSWTKKNQIEESWQSFWKWGQLVLLTHTKKKNETEIVDERKCFKIPNWMSTNEISMLPSVERHKIEEKENLNNHLENFPFCQVEKRIIRSSYLVMPWRSTERIHNIENCIHFIST